MTGVADPRLTARARWGHLLVLPLYAAVPLLAVVLLWWRGGVLSWFPLAAGAVGWTVALGLRAPVALAAKRISGSLEHVRLAVVASSGPAEELVRLAAVLLAGRTFSPAFSLGIGWASIEVVQAAAAGFVLIAALEKGGEDAEAARTFLESFGMPLDRALGSVPLRLAVVGERVSASAFHIGATLLVASNPFLVLATIPVHSGMNLLTVVPVLRRRIWILEGLVAAVGGGVLAAGLLAV